MFDKEQCSVQELEDHIVADASRLAASTARWLMLLAAFDRREGWSGAGIRSCAHWLSWKVGLGLRAAHEHLRVARALENLPIIREAFLAGQLSYAKVRALARVATADNESDLVALARAMPAAHLERLARAYRAVTRDDANQRHRRRLVEWRYDDDGTVIFRIRLPPEDAAVVIKGITAAVDTLTPPPTDPAAAAGPADGDPARDPHAPGDERARTTRADGLVAMAETFLAAGAHPRSDPDRYATIIHTDASQLAASEPTATEPTATEPTNGAAGRATNAHLGTPVTVHRHLDRGPALDPATIDRLRCDSPALTLIRHRTHHPGPAPGVPIGPGETLIDLGRRTHDPNPALRRAIRYRDNGHCQYPACPNATYTDIHHIRAWHPDGPTTLANLTTLCRWHHRDHHEGGYTITTTPDGTATFRRPDGTEIPQAPIPPTPSPQPRTDHVDAAAITPDWHGDSLNLDYTLTHLLTRGR